MNKSDTVSIKNTTKGKLPSLPFVSIAQRILGKDYELSIVIVGEHRIRSLNKKYRDQDKATDILSFSLDDKSGEIFINPNQAKKKAKLFNTSYNKYMTYLLIHGMLHLKGLEHGSRMDSKEKKLCQEFGIDSLPY